MSSNATTRSTGTNSERKVGDKRRPDLISEFAKPNHKAVARMTGFALSYGTVSMFLKLSGIVEIHLAPRERAGLAMAMLLSLSQDHALLTARTALGFGNGPLPPFLDIMDDAKTWVANASVCEIEAYCLACFLTMPKARKVAFLDMANREVGQSWIL